MDDGKCRTIKNSLEGSCWAPPPPFSSSFWLRVFIARRYYLCDGSHVSFFFVCARLVLSKHTTVLAVVKRTKFLLKVTPPGSAGRPYMATRSLLIEVRALLWFMTDRWQGRVISTKGANLGAPVATHHQPTKKIKPSRTETTERRMMWSNKLGSPKKAR